MGSRRWALFSIFRRHRAKRALVPAIEIAGIKKGSMERWSRARAGFRGGLLFPHAGGGSGGGAPGHRYLRDLRNSEDRASFRRACSRPKFRIHSIGRSLLGRSWRDWEDRGKRAAAGDDR